MEAHDASLDHAHHDDGRCRLLRSRRRRAADENVFNYPGLGKLAFDSTKVPDLPTKVDIVVVLSCIVVIMNIVVDCLYAVVDPRVKLA